MNAIPLSVSAPLLKICIVKNAVKWKIVSQIDNKANRWYNQKKSDAAKMHTKKSQGV